MKKKLAVTDELINQNEWPLSPNESSSVPPPQAVSARLQFPIPTVGGATDLLVK